MVLHALKGRDPLRITVRDRDNRRKVIKPSLIPARAVAGL